jgi:hypothetical protein
MRNAQQQVLEVDAAELAVKNTVIELIIVMLRLLAEHMQVSNQVADENKVLMGSADTPRSGISNVLCKCGVRCCGVG